MKVGQLWLISCMEKSLKSFEREHQEEALILAISTRVVQEEALFWNVSWLCSNQLWMTISKYEPTITPNEYRIKLETGQIESEMESVCVCFRVVLSTFFRFV